MPNQNNGGLDQAIEDNPGNRPMGTGSISNQFPAPGSGNAHGGHHTAQDLADQLAQLDHTPKMPRLRR